MENAIYIMPTDMGDLSVTKEDVNDIMVTALEGGINYWVASVNKVGKPLGSYASEHLASGGALELILIDPDDDGSGEKTLTLEDFCTGLKTWYENGYDHHMAVTPAGVDPGSIDSEEADAIIQCALYGDIIYS